MCLGLSIRVRVQSLMRCLFRRVCRLCDMRICEGSLDATARGLVVTEGTICRLIDPA